MKLIAIASFFLTCLILKSHCMEKEFFEINGTTLLDCSDLKADVLTFATLSKPDVPIVASEKFEITNKTLKIKALDESDLKDVYFCKDGSNPTANLTFNRHPFIYKSRENDVSHIKIAPGFYKMICKAIDENNRNGSDYIWSWQFKNKTNTEWKKLEIVLLENPSMVFIVTHNTTNSTLEIPLISAEYEGDYKCIAENSFGKHSLEFPLVVLGFQAILWPYIGIFTLVVILASIILICERITRKKLNYHSANDEIDYGKPINA